MSDTAHTALRVKIYFKIYCNIIMIIMIIIYNNVYYYQIYINNIL